MPRLVADRFDEAPAGSDIDEVGAEEAELDQHRLHVGQREDRLEVRDQDVVERT